MQKFYYSLIPSYTVSLITMSCTIAVGFVLLCLLGLESYHTLPFWLLVSTPVCIITSLPIAYFTIKFAPIYVNEKGITSCTKNIFVNRTIPWDNIDSVSIRKLFGFDHFIVKPKSGGKSLKILCRIDNIEGFFSNIEHFAGEIIARQFKHGKID